MKVIISFLFKLTILFLVLWGAHAWFTWPLDFLDSTRTAIVNFIPVIIAFFYKSIHKIDIKITRNVFFAFFCLFLAGIQYFSIGSTILFFFRTIPLLVLFYDQKNINDVLDFVTNSLAIFLLPGIVLYFILIYNPMPGLPIKYEMEGVDQYVFMNYFILIKSALVDYPRFQSVFLESGYLGSLLSFLLYCREYKFKNNVSNIILLIALLTSFSLAGYATLFIGYILYQYSIGKLSHKVWIVAGIVLIVYLLGTRINGGDNFINDYLLSRLESDEETIITGNNRFSNSTNILFEQYSGTSKILWGFGYDDSTLDISGAGYKVFLLRNGLLSAVFYLFFYIFLSFTSKDKKYSFGFLILIVLTFLQAAYPSSLAWTIPYMIGINLSNKKRNANTI